MTFEFVNRSIFRTLNYDPVQCHYSTRDEESQTQAQEVCPGCRGGDMGHLAPWWLAVGHYYGEQCMVWCEGERDRMVHIGWTEAALKR